MSDIFISYKREEQAIAKKLADALESEGWTVWWDPKLRAGEHFDDVIEKALNEAKCGIVMWSNLSVNSEYVKAEATEALEQKKLVPVKIENAILPFRFKRVHTLSLLGWDGSKDFPEFRRLVEDIAAIVGPPATTRQKTQRAESKAEPGTISRDKLKGGSTRLPPDLKRKLEPGTVFRDKLKDGSQGPQMVVIPAGTFQMGDGRGFARPVRTVRIISPFAIGRYEVTFEEYDRFVAATGHKLPDDDAWGRGRRPVINVSWNDVMEYAKWFSTQTGKHYRLPSEAEWEYAARSGTEERWAGTSFEEELGDYAWYRANSGGMTQPVGGKKPNRFGLYDMSGNVWEWIEDCRHENYKDAPTNGSPWKEEGGGDCFWRVRRGGSWENVPKRLCSSGRDWVSPVVSGCNIGFRLARDL
jgi:formylglycine-generating enzyme required for sulfatase activity